MTALRPERDGTDLSGDAALQGYGQGDPGHYLPQVNGFADPLTDPLTADQYHTPAQPESSAYPALPAQVAPDTQDAWSGQQSGPGAEPAAAFDGALLPAHLASSAMAQLPADPDAAADPERPLDTALLPELRGATWSAGPGPGERTEVLPASRPDQDPPADSARSSAVAVPGGRAARRRAAQGTQAVSAGALPGPGTRAALRRGGPQAAAATPAISGGRAARRRAGQEPDGAVALPAGRAARRKAAQEEARRKRRAPGAHGRRARRAAPPAELETAGESTQPMSRVAARRAARAAKDGPAVVVSRVMGEVFITMGVLMLLFVAYQLWWTNVLAHQAAGAAADRLRDQWNDSHGGRPSAGLAPDESFALMYIPKLDVKVPIAEGISKHKVLDKGMVGHYSGSLQTGYPWDKQGNFAVAGHRNTHGEPFRYINRLQPGDKIIVETESAYYTYEMTSVLAATPPSNINVIQPIPPGSGFTKPGRYLTMTTCTPEFTSKYRLIVWGKMVAEQPHSQGKPAALMG